MVIVRDRTRARKDEMEKRGVKNWTGGSKEGFCSVERIKCACGRLQKAIGDGEQASVQLWDWANSSYTESRGGGNSERG